jgi:hypothetical protein
MLRLYFFTQCTRHIKVNGVKLTQRNWGILRDGDVIEVYGEGERITSLSLSILLTDSAKPRDQQERSLNLDRLSTRGDDESHGLRFALVREWMSTLMG